jgi:hypothetical protein
MSPNTVEPNRLQRALFWPFLVAMVISMVTYLFSNVVSWSAFTIGLILMVLIYDETQPLLGRLGRLVRGRHS